MQKTALALIPLVVFSVIGPAYAQERQTFCFEDYNCSIQKLIDSPFTGFLDYFDELMSGYGILILWGPVVFAIWIVSKSPMITATVGLIIAVSVTGLNPEAVGVGILLVTLSIAIAMFQLFPRIKQPLT